MSSPGKPREPGGCVGARAHMGCGASKKAGGAVVPSALGDLDDSDEDAAQELEEPQVT